MIETVMISLHVIIHLDSDINDWLYIAADNKVMPFQKKVSQILLLIARNLWEIWFQTGS